MTKIQKQTKNIIFSFIMFFIALVVSFPFIWMISSSFKTQVELMQLPVTFLPEQFNFDNFVTILSEQPFIMYYRNTFIVTILRTCAQIFFCSLAAFSFAKIDFKFKNFIFLSLLSVLMVPHQMILVPNYIIMKHLGLIDTILGVALPGMFSAFGMFLLRQFYMTLPDELIEAGKMDGCNYFMIFRRLLFPLTKPAVTALSIFTIMYSWKDLLWPLIISSSNNTRVLSVGMAMLQGQNRMFYNEIMAAAVMVVVPVVIIFVCLQKQFVAGIAMSGIKQ